MNDISNRADIKLLIDTFYGKVQTNKKLGYFFNEIAQVNWETHLPKMYDFWETILFHKAIYKGNPMKKHVELHQLAKLEKEHFEIWLGLFKSTVDELFEGDKAEQIKNRAMSIATAIQLNTVYQKK